MALALLEGRLAPILVFCLALLSLSVGIANLPVQDRDEARFAQASRQMAETGDWIDIRLQDAARHNKPAGIYWLQAATLRLAGSEGLTPIWLHRLPSLFAASLAALAMIWAGTPLVGRRSAVLAGVILATLYMVHAEARTAKTDAALLLSVVLAMGALGRVWLDEVKGWLVPAIFWTALAAGLLVKGPMVLLPVAGAILWLGVQGRSLRFLANLRPLPGIAWILLLVLPWIIAITIRTEGAFLAGSIGQDLTDKITTAGEHSGSPPGLYLLTVWFTFWPWCLLLPLALVHGWRTRSTAPTAFLLGWLIPGWLLFEAIPVKLIHYPLPLLPALALLAAAVLVRMADGSQAFRGWPALLGTFGFALATAFFAAVAIAAPIVYGAGISVLAAFGGGVMAVAAIVGAGLLWRGRTMAAIVALTLSSMAMGWTITGVSLPEARAFWLSPRMAAAMERLPCLAPPYAVVGFSEPSVVFQLGTDTVLSDADDALAYLADAPDRAAWIAAEALDAAPPPGVADLTEITGLNFANFSPVSLRLFVSPGVPAPDQPCS